MRYDPVRDVAPPALGSWWRDRVTGRRYQVVSYHQVMGRYVTTVTLQEPGTGPLSTQVLSFESFRAEFVPADPPPQDVRPEITGSASIDPQANSGSVTQ